MLAAVDAAGHFDDETGPPLPTNVHQALNGFGTDIFADYKVCPLTRSKLGHMQFVCVVSASNIVVQTFGKPPRRVRETGH